MQKYGRLFLAFCFGVLLLSLTLPALAIQLHGDWESSGDPTFTPPYSPTYDYQYLCQMEIGDGKYYPAPSGVMSKRFVVIRELLNKNTTSVHTKDRKLVVVQSATDKPGKDFVLNEAAPFEVENDMFWLTIKPGKTPGGDRVQLQIQASLKFGEQIVLTNEIKTFPRERENFTMVAEQTSHNADYSETRSKRVFVICQRQR